MKTFNAFLIATACAVASPALAAPTVIDFSGHQNDIYEAPITKSGFQFGNIAGGEQHFHLIDSTLYGLASNGTSVLLNDRDTSLFLQAIGGAAFSLSSIDVAASFGNLPANSLRIHGFLGGMLTSSLTIGTLGNFQTVNTGSFANVDRVVFDGLGGQGGFELDNVVLNSAVAAVPEPASWAMMLAGFGGIGFAMRRRKNGVTTRVAYS